MDNEELVLTINKIISYIKENGPSKMHLIDAHIKIIIVNIQFGVDINYHWVNF